MKYSFTIALARTTRGLIAGVIAGLGTIQVSGGGAREVILAGLVGLLGALLTDIDAYMVTRSKQD